MKVKTLLMESTQLWFMIEVLLRVKDQVIQEQVIFLGLKGKPGFSK